MINGRKSLAFRIWMIVLLAILLSTGSFCAVSMIEANNAIKLSARQRMLDIANCAAGSVDGDTYKRLNESSELNPGYRRVYNALAIFRDNIEADSVYAIREEEDGSFIITIDPSLESPGEFGDKVVTTDALIKASKGISAVDDKPYTDRWGTFYSAYSPVHDSDGNIVGVVAVDFTKEWYEGQQKEQAKNTLLTFLVVLCITLIVIGILCSVHIRSITKPMRHITEVAECYRQGDFSRKLEIDREDELGVLSRALQSMATSLTEQIKEADAANNAKSSFLANMSHEIRTPINAVLGMNEMILRESSDPEIHTYSENVKTAGNTLLSIINDILDFSKIEAGKLEIIPVDYDLSSVINDLVNMIHTRADDKGLKLVLDFNHEIPKQLYGDSVRVKQVITNILTNAVKYTEKGSITFSMDFERIKEEPDMVLLKVSVKDTGIGIKEEDKNKLFSEFERIEEKRNRNIEGTGLGMNITQNLLEMMGSALVVNSVYGEGSTFSFILKQKVVGDEVLGDYENSYRMYLSKTEGYKEKFTAPRAKILVVDDNPMNLMVFGNLVKQTLVMTDTANSGDEALLLMRDKKYDMIFLDHMMPEKDGIMTLQEMKQEKDNPNLNTPTVCLTANAISGARETYISAGFDDYLTKPIDPDRLENMLMKYLPDDLVEMARVDDSDTVKTPDEDSGLPEELRPLSGQNKIDIKQGIKNSGTADAYLPLLKVFYDSADSKAEEINGYYSGEDYKNYTIKVHALKSSARIIGAMDFGEAAQRLEDAGKAEDYEYIHAHHNEFMEEYGAIKELVAAVFEKESDEEDRTVAEDWLMAEAYKQIKEAAVDMDCDALETAFEEMSSYAIPENEAELWKKVKAASDSFDYDGVISLLADR
ncbi:response regulator [Butyrivibrio sp. VCD2006]|uniref:response regulator n=1 Tax=Butyrivibrio sp. VCD2006 TaxID=1280664 RepID=UPI0003FA12FE|nr:response regulator [Butyrivibrio sp. VCD2006]